MTIKYQVMCLGDATLVEASSVSLDGDGHLVFTDKDNALVMAFNVRIWDAVKAVEVVAEAVKPAKAKPRPPSPEITHPLPADMAEEEGWS